MKKYKAIQHIGVSTEEMVDEDNTGKFQEKVGEAISKMQEDGLTVEVQYSTCPYDADTEIEFSAIVLGWAEE